MVRTAPIRSATRHTRRASACSKVKPSWPSTDTPELNRHRPRRENSQITSERATLRTMHVPSGKYSAVCLPRITMSPGKWPRCRRPANMNRAPARNTVAPTTSSNFPNSVMNLFYLPPTLSQTGRRDKRRPSFDCLPNCVYFQFSLLPIPVAQFRLLANQRDLLAGDEDVPHVSLYIQRIAVGHHHVGRLAYVQRSQVFVHAEHLRGIESDGLQSLVRRQPKAHGVSGGVGQVAGVVRVVGRESDLHAAPGQFRWYAIDGVIALPLFRLLVDWPHDHRKPAGCNFVQHLVGVRDVVEDDLEMELFGHIHDRLYVVGLFRRQHHRLLAVQVRQQSFEPQVAFRRSSGLLRVAGFFLLVSSELALVILRVEECLAQLRRHAHSRLREFSRFETLVAPLTAGEVQRQRQV